jgi:hypothetical protein
MDDVQPVPDDFPVVPVGRPGYDDDRTLRLVSVAALFGTGAQEV